MEFRELRLPGGTIESKVGKLDVRERPYDGTGCQNDERALPSWRCASCAAEWVAASQVSSPGWAIEAINGTVWYPPSLNPFRSIALSKVTVASEGSTLLAKSATSMPCPQPGSGSASTTESNSQICKSCGLCCTGLVTDRVLLEPARDKLFIHLVDKQVEVKRNESAMWYALPCPLWQGECTEYQSRPHDCQTYQCKLLRNVIAGNVEMKSALDIVSDARSALDALVSQSRRSCLVDSEGPSQVYIQLHKKLDGLKPGIDERRAFWLRYPSFLTLKFLLRRHFLG
jgi:hypothetical protein